MAKDWRAILRSKPIVIPMIAVPSLLLLVIPIMIGLFAGVPRSPTSIGSSPCRVASPTRSSSSPSVSRWSC